MAAMAENEPLDESVSQPNGRIISAESRVNGHALRTSNGQVYRTESNGKISVNGIQQHIEAPCCRDIHGKEPPDGGARAWLVMVSAFLCNGVIFGLINTYGVLHKLLTERMTAQGDAEANSKAGKSKCQTAQTTSSASVGNARLGDTPNCSSPLSIIKTEVQAYTQPHTIRATLNPLHSDQEYIPL